MQAAGPWKEIMSHMISGIFCGRKMMSGLTIKARQGIETRTGRKQVDGLLLFLYFLFSFFTKIYVRVRNLHEYTPAALLPGGRDLAARPPGGRDLSVKKLTKNYTDVPRGPATRQRGGQPSRPPGTGAAGPLHQCRGFAAVCVISCYEDTKQEQPANKSTRIVSWQQVSFF